MKTFLVNIFFQMKAKRLTDGEWIVKIITSKVSSKLNWEWAQKETVRGVQNVEKSYQTCDLHKRLRKIEKVTENEEIQTFQKL